MFYSFSLTFEHDANEFIRQSQQAVAKFELDPATSQQFTYGGARVHRYTTHPSTDGRSILTITEVIPLKSRICSIDDHVVYIGEEAKPGEDSPRLKNYFSLSIESVAGKKFLGQNEKLELGQEAGWTPETMASAGIAKDLYIPACVMLTGMDRVGYHNSNGLVPEALPERVLPLDPSEVAYAAPSVSRTIFQVTYSKMQKTDSMFYAGFAGFPGKLLVNSCSQASIHFLLTSELCLVPSMELSDLASQVIFSGRSSLHFFFRWRNLLDIRTK